MSNTNQSINQSIKRINLEKKIHFISSSGPKERFQMFFNQSQALAPILVIRKQLWKNKNIIQGGSMTTDHLCIWLWWAKNVENIRDPPASCYCYPVGKTSSLERNLLIITWPVWYPFKLMWMVRGCNKIIKTFQNNSIAIL